MLYEKGLSGGVYQAWVARDGLVEMGEAMDGLVETGE